MSLADALYPQDAAATLEVSVAAPGPRGAERPDAAPVAAARLTAASAGMETRHDLAVAIYISLMKWTSPGMGGMPGWRDRLEEGERMIEQRGGKRLGAYVTLGRFDLVEIFEAPDDETAYQCIVAVARTGNVTTETLRAFTREEAEALIKAL